MSVLFSPWGNQQFFDENGAPAVGWKIYTYAAGSSTDLASYTSSTGASAQTNPIILNALGFPETGQIWLTSGLSYKLVLTDEDGVVKKTEDGVTGVNDPSIISTTDQWVVYTGTPTYISATSFSVSGDQTSTFQVGRRLKSTNTGGTRYSSITASSFGAGITTVTVVNDSGTLDSGLSQVSYGLISPTSSSAPTIGVGQSVTDVTASRALGSTYTNSTGRPIVVYIAASVTGGTVTVASIAGVVVGRIQSNQGGGLLDYGTMTLIVPPGVTYTASAGGATLVSWVELR